MLCAQVGYLEDLTLDEPEYCYPDQISELSDFLNAFDNPMDLLQIADRRRAIVEVLLKSRGRAQLGLFATEEQTLDEILRDIADLTDSVKRLYKRFLKTVGVKTRELSIAQRPVERLLKEYAIELIKTSKVHEQCHGSEIGWSPRRSISTHIPIGCVLSFDLSKAFMNIDIGMIFKFYKSAISKLNMGNDLLVRDIAGFLACVSTVYYRDSGMYALPQGSPISSAVFNRILYPIDNNLDKYARKNRLVYSRWGDDFIISSRYCDIDEDILFYGPRFVAKSFKLSESKLYLQRKEPFYLLGQRVIGRNIASASDRELKSRENLSYERTMGLKLN